MEKYYKIGEIATLYNIGSDSLRYYEELGILAPRRAENGYRLYSVNDMWRLNVIRDLRELGFSMAQIRRYLENRSIDSTIALLSEELEAIRQKRKELKQLEQNVSQRLHTIQKAKNRQLGVVEQKAFPLRCCHQIPEGYLNDEEMDVLIKRLLNIDKQKLYVVGNNQIGSRIGLEVAREGRFREYHAVFIIDEKGQQQIEGGDYLTVSYRGDCVQNATYIPMMLQYADERGLTPKGDILELLWVDIHASANVQEHITELQLRVEKDSGGGV